MARRWTRRARAPIFVAMNLLLLLSALLSALTGIGNNARVPEAATAIAAKIDVARLAVDAVIPPAPRPSQVPPSLREVAYTPMPPVAILAFDKPLYASRRRE